MLKLIHFSRKLSNINRFASYKLDRGYSVADHCFRTSILAMQIADHYNKHNKNQVNVEEVLRKALLHDIEEASTGDIPQPIKVRCEEFKAAYKKLAKIIVKEDIMSGNEFAEFYTSLWENDKQGQSGEIILIADVLEGFQTVTMELRRGNNSLKGAYENILKELNKPKLSALLEKYQFAKMIYLEYANLTNHNNVE
jgi:5'-deoxynucleotidase YfbR-like HD superfamily hydrolase